MKYSQVENEEVTLKLDKQAVRSICWCIRLALEQYSGMEDLCKEEIKDLHELSNFLWKLK